MGVELAETIEGTVLNYRYQVDRVLNDKGGMGLIYLATDLNLRTHVVLKKSRFVDEQSRAAFEREARLLYGLRHNALPRVIDYFITEDASQFFVMEFIPGQDLSEMLGERVERGEGPFAIDLVLDWGDQLLDALHYLHTHEPQIIHRDIKPQNLKLMPNGQIILLDFGLAKGAVSGMTLASASIQGYTPNYAPLEQMRGSGTDARSDIYSLAVTMHCLLTGQMPPDAVSRAIETLSAQPDPLHPIHEINPNFPHPISEALQRACSLNQNERPATAQAMREVLREARQLAAQLANPPEQLETQSGPPAGVPERANGPAAHAATPSLEVSAPAPAPDPPKVRLNPAEMPSSVLRQPVAPLAAQGKATEMSSTPEPSRRPEPAAPEHAAGMLAPRAKEASVRPTPARSDDGLPPSPFDTVSDPKPRLDASSQYDTVVDPPHAAPAFPEPVKRPLTATPLAAQSSRPEALRREPAAVNPPASLRREPSKPPVAAKVPPTAEEPPRPTSLMLIEHKDERRAGRAVEATPPPEYPVRANAPPRLALPPHTKPPARPAGTEPWARLNQPPVPGPPSQRPPNQKPAHYQQSSLSFLREPPPEVEKPSQGDVLPKIDLTGVLANPNHHGAVTPKGMRSFTEIIALNVRMEMHAIPGGEFLMGSPEKRGYADEYPQHRVTLSAFYIGKYPVTQAQWRAVMRTNPSHFPGNNHPVDSITWDEAIEFCRRLSYATNRTYRLPTEAEWEFACRAGTGTLYNYGDEEELILQYAWCLPNSSNHTHPVGEKKPNGWGLYDTHGNVWEWCQDWYSSDYYQYSPNVNPPGPTKGTSRVLRGGSWYSLPNYCRSAGRSNHQPDLRDPLVGFRVVCDAKPS